MTEDPGPGRYPGYDVLDKRWTPSWNAKTRSVIDRRLAVHPGPRFLPADLFRVLEALCARILPQDDRAAPVPLAAYVDEKLHLDKRAGYRNAKLPPLREAWTRGLQALDAEAQGAYGRSFADLDPASQDHLIGRMQKGELVSPAWGGMPCGLFFKDRVMSEIPRAYYAHPAAWSEMGFGGPASPRGYVRLDADKRDPWEAAEAHGDPAKAQRINARAGR
jgi:hypothetical protein